MPDNGSESSVPEDLSRLMMMSHDDGEINVDLVRESLRRDSVVLIRNVAAEQVDSVVHRVADRLGLGDALKLQASLTGFIGYRDNIGKYFMSVNKRGDYQFIPPHSEGSSFLGIQLASLFCYENSTDGGETILMNVDDSSTEWQLLREKVKRGRLGSRPLAPHEVLRARGLHQIHLPADLLRETDQILRELQTDIAGLAIVEVLAKPRKTYSRILDRELNVYWDTIASIDFDSAREYADLLRQCGLLKEPQGGLQLPQMDTAAHRRVWHSGVHYTQLFKCKITRRLVPGDLIIQNNLTWAHAASNWSPNSGTRNVAAAFA